MKHAAKLLLASGVIIIVLALSVAVSAMTGSDNIIFFEEPATTADACLFCHVDAHDSWTLISTSDPQQTTSNSLQSSSQNVIISASDLLCGNCHPQSGNSALSTDEIQSSINSVQERVAALRADLNLVFDLHVGDWDSDAYLRDKAANQIAAERINTLLGVIEADGSWGFHDPDYTEDILTEAETLLERLLNGIE